MDQLKMFLAISLIIIFTLLVLPYIYFRCRQIYCQRFPPADAIAARRSNLVVTFENVVELQLPDNDYEEIFIRAPPSSPADQEDNFGYVVPALPFRNEINRPMVYCEKCAYVMMNFDSRN